MPALTNSGAPFLSRLPLFADVSHETLARFEHRMRRRKFAPRLDAANRHAGFDFVNLSRVRIDLRVLRLLPQADVHQHRVVPVSFADNRLIPAVTNPFNGVTFDDARRVITGVLIEPVVVTEDDFKRFMWVTCPQLVAQDDVAPPAGETREKETAKNSVAEVTSVVSVDI